MRSVSLEYWRSNGNILGFIGGDGAGAAAAPAGEKVADPAGRGNVISSKSTEEATSSVHASDSSARGVGAGARGEMEKAPLVVEGRRCELCGRGSESIEELSTSAIVAGGDSTVGRGGLGRLLGPVSDKMGVAAVWIHQECAVWSPEVYFLGVGCLKNVRAALRRGRFLKCSRCKQPGATIGCRVACCPRTYHLPCARQSACSFNHKRYLMSCADHVKHFLVEDKKRLRECMIDDQLTKKNSREVRVVAETAEDDEFLKREKKRLHRDLARLAPVVLGGDNAKPDAVRYEGWESIGGLRDVVQCLKEMVTLPLLYPDMFHKVGIVPPRGVLLHGYPGTGKTLVVRALLGACSRGPKKIAYFSRKGADCLGKYVGDSERQLRLLFQLAEQSQPSIIFFDEIDGLAPKRTRNQDQTHSSVVSTLLALMDGLSPRGSVVVIGATNRPDSIDPALRRAGRFDREIFFPLPSVADRESILRVHTKSWKQKPTREVVSAMARSTVGFAGADLQALCAQAAMTALKRTVCLQDLVNSPVNQSTALPDIQVETSDWTEALARAGPPCSRRLLGSALSEIEIAPLPRYLAPVLLRPIISVLRHLESDGRFNLPIKLRKPIGFVAERKLLDSATRWSSAALEELMNSCRGSGIVAGDDGDDSDDDRSISELTLIRPLVNAWKTGSLRILLTGCERDGKNLVAASILYVFQSCMQVFLISLQTMIQAGSGLLCDGLIQILSEAKAVASLVFMPRLESWAVEKGIEPDPDGETMFVSSELWKTFLQQIRSLPSDLPVFFLATADRDLPSEILSFFTSPHPKTVASRACVEIPVPTKNDVFDVFNRAADLFVREISSPKQQKSDRFVRDTSSAKQQEDDRFVRDTSSPKQQEADASSPMDNLGQDPRRTRIGSTDTATSPAPAPSREPAKPRTPSLDAIRCCGNQLLNSPHFIAIRQATLRLNSGPSIYLENPYSGQWQVRDNVETEKAVETEAEKSARTTNEEANVWQLALGRALGLDPEDNEPSRTVRGLDAVGLKACKGYYATGGEMVSEIKTVIGLFREKLFRKSRGRRGQWFRSQLLAQAGALQDLMECWVHELRRLENRDKKPKLPQAAPDRADPVSKPSSSPRRSVQKLERAPAARRKMDRVLLRSPETMKARVAELFVKVWDGRGNSLMVEDVHDVINETLAMVFTEVEKQEAESSSENRLIAAVNIIENKECVDI